MEKYDFGNRLYEYRTQKGLTQKELGKLLGVTDKAVSKWETGESKPRLDKMKQITELFETSIDGMLGEESDSNGEALKPYKTIFDLNLEKKNKQYKASRIVTVIVGLLAIIDSCLGVVMSFANSGATIVDFVNMFETIILTLGVFAISLNIKNKFDENPEKYIKATTIVSFLLFTIASILFSINYYLVYRFAENADYAEPIVLGIFWVIVLIIFVITMIFKKGYQVLGGLISGFSIGALFAFETNSSLFAIPMMMGVQMAFLAEKYNWLKLANKAEIDYKSEEKKHTKLVKVLTILISISLVLSILTSWLAPYITYISALKISFPNGYNIEQLSYDYKTKFDDEDCQIGTLKNLKYRVPKGYEIVEKTYDDEDSVFYKDENNVVSFCYNSKEYNQEFDFAADNMEGIDEAKEAKLKYIKAKMRMNFGVSWDNFYEYEYLNHVVDITDVKFYETEKAMAMVPILFVKAVAMPMGEHKSMYFDDGDKCGFIDSYDTTDIGDSIKRVMVKATVWKSYDTGGEFYDITYMSINGDKNAIYTMCKFINSLEF